MRISRRQFTLATGAIAAANMVPLAADESVVALANSRRAELIDLLSALIRVQSISGESAGDAQKVVKDYLRDLPYHIEESADRPSLYESHPEFMPPNPQGDGPFINIIGWPEQRIAKVSAMFSHIDTHSIDDGWESDPLSPVIRNGRMYGLGTSDDKGGVAAMLVAASILASKGGRLPVVMSLHGKGGGSRGSLPVFDRLSKTDHGIQSVLYVHPAETGRGLEDIKNAVQGVVDFRLTVRGWRSPQMEIGSIDSSDWATGGNALDKCWELIEILRAGVFHDVQFNLGAMQGGDRVGSVADEATATFRLKFTGDYTWHELLDSAREAIEDVVSGRWQSSLDLAGYRTNPGEADWTSPPSRALRSAIEDVTGRTPEAYPNHYAGDIRYPIRLLGSPAYGIGSIGGNFYGPNEWVDIDDLVNLVAVLVITMDRWAS
jgi:acetylornithine deacetylase